MTWRRRRGGWPSRPAASPRCRPRTACVTSCPTRCPRGTSRFAGTSGWRTRRGARYRRSVISKRERVRPILPVALLAALLAGCAGGGHASGDPDPGGVRGGGGRPEPLGEPPPGDPAAPGADYLDAVHGRFRAPWGAFLEDCRLRLPRDHV